MSGAGPDPTCCDYCGLPVRPPSTRLARAEITANDQAVYCCFGCRFAAAVTAEKGEPGQTQWQLAQLGLAIFFSMNVMVFTVALWTQDVYASDATLSAQQATALHGLFRWMTLLFSAPVVVTLGISMLENALQDLRRGAITTDQLLVLGVAAALGYSVVSVLRGTGHVYFEVVCMVLVAVTLGRWLEATGKIKTTQALSSLERLLPETVRLVEDHQQRAVPRQQIAVNQVVRVLPGERIAFDGRVERNRASIDQQIVTGESQPVTKSPGDPVLAGTLNLDGDLWVRVTAPATEGTLQRLVDAVRRCAARKTQVQRLADQLTSWFIPTVIVVAIISFTVHALTSGWIQAILAALAVLLIACPCALAIATPLALWAALGRASRGQVLFRDGDALVRLAKVRNICFDKTGTLTSGDAEVDQLITAPGTPRNETLRKAHSLASTSTHGLSTAIGSFEVSQPATAPRDPRSLPGRGITATIDGHTVYLGSLRMMQESDLQQSEKISSAIAAIRRAGQALTCIGWKGQVQGVFAFRERLRESAQAAVEQMCSNGYRLAVLTGDHTIRMTAIQPSLGIEAATQLLPEDKLAAIERIRKQWGPVAMVGDGINDAPALAAADVGLAMGCGADVSRDAATVCLLGNDLARIPWAIQLAQRTVRTIRLNLFWTLAYNSVGIALAATGRLNPMVAAVAMVGSSLFVLTNSLRLARDEETPLEQQDGRHADPQTSDVADLVLESAAGR